MSEFSELLEKELKTFQEANKVLQSSNDAAKRNLEKLRTTVPSVEKWTEAEGVLERLYTAVLIQNNCLTSLTHESEKMLNRIRALESARL